MTTLSATAGIVVPGKASRRARAAWPANQAMTGESTARSNGVRRALVGEQDAEHGDEDRAASQQDTRPGTGGGGQQGPAGPRAFHEAPLEESPLTLSGHGLLCLHR